MPLPPILRYVSRIAVVCGLASSLGVLAADDGSGPRATGISVALGSARAGEAISLGLGSWHGVVTPSHVESRANGWSVWGAVEGGGSFAFSSVGGVCTGGVWTDAGAIGVTPRLVDGRLVSVAAPIAGPEVRCAGEGEAPGHASPESTSLRGGDAGAGALAFDDPSFVDVLFVYTPAARDAAGGIAALTSRIQNTVDSANLVFANSGIDDLSLVVAGIEEIEYDEVSPQWLDHLVRLSGTDDGYMDNVHAMRDAHHADCVMLLVDDTRFTGGAAWWAIWDQGSAFSVLNWRSAGGGILTGPHEFGHNFGCAHDHENDASAPFSFAWGHYYDFDGTTYGTVMSYPGEVVLPTFSNPLHTGPGGQPEGVPIGEPRAAFNALVVEHSRWTLAGYRQSGRVLDCDNNGVPDADDIAGGAPDVNGDGRPDSSETHFYVDHESSPQGDGESWGGALADLGETLALANLLRSDITELWVADGIYRPDSGTADPWRGFSLSPGQRVYGGFEGQSRPGGGETSLGQRDPATHETVLSGDIGVPGDDTDNSYSVVRAESLPIGATLDGMTICGGRSFADASGLYVSGASVTIRGCTFTDNIAPGNGAGATLVSGSSALFDDCVFDGNQAGWTGGAIALFDASVATVQGGAMRHNTAQYGGAAEVTGGGSLTFLGATLEDNTADQGAGAIDADIGSTLEVRDSVFTGNHATASWSGAIRVGGGSTLRAARCTFTGNTSGWIGGAISVADSDARIDACTFETNDTSDYGGGIDLYNTRATIASCAFRGNTSGIDGGAISIGGGSTITLAASTLAANDAANLGGGLVTSDSDVGITSSILWANTSGGAGQDDQFFAYSGTLTAEYSDVQALALGGPGNIDADPLFVSSTDLSLAPGSPCIDAGRNAGLPPDDLDLDDDGDTGEVLATDAVGLARRVDDPATPDTGVGPAPIVDMGAYEFAPAPCPADLAPPFGVLDLQDVIAFIGAFTTQDPLGDLNGDGIYDLRDVLAFIAAFTGGCP
ncbi:MAG: right-handed parallel beta-helix repeat-containing protein [Phycisphaeraceae bacterium]|nr:MAG: right-handed parallel beta-helix repeat-containing protein [Phycisphaeraceae bacterium]